VPRSNSTTTVIVWIDEIGFESLPGRRHLSPYRYKRAAYPLGKTCGGFSSERYLEAISRKKRA
jgi:hypothetical protein